MFKFVLLVAAVALAAQQAAADHSSSWTPSGNFNFEVKMNGKLNNVKTKAQGKIKAMVDINAQTITGTMNLKNIKGVQVAHFHIGAAGVMGPPIAFIWPIDTKAATTQAFDTKDWTVPFTIKATDLTFTTTGSTPLVPNFGALVTAIINGQIYANVHTLANMEGEIRGQTYVDHHSR